MKANFKKTIFWGTIITPMVLAVFFLLGGYQALAAGHHGHGPGGMGPRGDFGGHHFMNGPHHGGFPWLSILLFIIIGLAVLVLLVKLLKKKAKASSMKQFIETSFTSTHRPIVNQNERLLDQWEINVTNKKENE